MKVLLLANQPESTIRLKLTAETLKDLGYHVIVPSFGTRNWITIARACRSLIGRERPEVVHIFNVPDIIYHHIPSLKGSEYTSLIYDYRSPWGIEYQMNFGHIGRKVAERYERSLAQNADLITTVNTPLKEKVRNYLDGHQDVHLIPNYPKRSFLSVDSGDSFSSMVNNAVLFVGRVCKQEGIENFIKAARKSPQMEFWIVGDGPFSWYYLILRPENLIFLGWQPHDSVAGFIKKAGICLIPREENSLTPYSNDKSIWKLNEYLNLGKKVIASGISQEEPRKNLIICHSKDLPGLIQYHFDRPPEPLATSDYRFWENNRDLIKKAYESL